MPKTLFVLCGIPGSGKSYVAHNLLRKFNPYIYIQSRDMVRFSLVVEGEEYFSKEKQVFQEWVKGINHTLWYYDQPVIADATHLTKASRRKLLSAIAPKDCIHVVFVVIESNVHRAIERNATRAGRECVPESVIMKMHRSFEMPTEAEALDLGFAGADVMIIKN